MAGEQEPDTNGASSAQSFAPLPFDENLVAALSAASSASASTSDSGLANGSAYRNPHSASAGAASSVVGMGGNKSAADFFLDQIAAVVADEKKLSDNIMDLIPPVETPGSQISASSLAAASATTSLTMPLAPPPDLMMRALSPPTSLLPDFGDPTPLSLLGESSSASSASVSGAGAIQMPANLSSVPTMTTVTTPVKRDVPTVKPAAKSATSAAANLRRKATENATAVSQALKKRKTITSEAFADVKTESTPSLASSKTTSAVPAHHQLHHQQARHHLHNSSSSAMSASAAAAAAAAAAREKVMKEPQSGDLYECVITKRNGGLGLTLACVDDHVQITGLAPDTPAANSGICVGDTLVAVSGLPVRGLQFSTVIGRLKSTSRNSVMLKLRRNPFRQNAGGSASYRGMKRPARGAAKGSESSNSANVLSNKNMALETRLGGGLGVSSGLGSTSGALANSNGLHNGSATPTGLDDLHHTHRAHHQSAGYPSHSAGLHHAHQLQMKNEPMNSTYFPTDASILTMGHPTALGAGTAGGVSTSTSASSSSSSELSWRVAVEEKERYYAECRALRHELGRAMVARRMEKRDSETYTSQLQAVADQFQRDMQTLLPSTSASQSDVELTTLRQKLLEANHALAKQQAETLALKERETRHALPEAQRIKWQLVARMRKSVLQVDCRTAAKTPSLAAKRLGTTTATQQQSTNSALAFEERLEGVRSSAFALLVGQESSSKPGKATTAHVELELDAKACAQLLGWNLREVVAQGGSAYTVSVMDAVHVKYLRPEEALIVSWTLSVRDATSKK